ncbi:ABC transporter permease subunit [Klebsiella pneumoniae]
MHSTTSQMSTRDRIGAILRVTSGNFLEQFDFFLFGFYATYIAHTFFPASSEFASLMMTFAVFGAGFLMRPIGAIVLGAYIDKVGRRKGLIVTLSIMATGTFLIVLIPSYQTIGLWAPLLVMIFAITLHWLPGGGWNGGALKFMILPMVALSLAYIASIARITRGSMIEVLHSNFIRTARAKGLPMRRIILRHALKPALLPVLSYMGPAFVGIITGSMVIETIYGLPGIGQLFVNGALNRDYSLVLSLTILVGALTILFNAIVDVLYAVIDPKIRY